MSDAARSVGATCPAAIAPPRAPDDLWVFGYGSLMWRPGFAYVEAQKAVLVGYQRAFCVYSTHHRGTEARPGLVLGLDQGGTCHGVAFRIAPDHRSAVHAYLRAREQINGVYREIFAPVGLETGKGVTVDAMMYVVERAHPSYAGHLPIARQARIIRSAEGLSGPNVDYLANTVARARQLGLAARDLERLLTVIGPFFGRAARQAGGTSPEARALVSRCKAFRCAPRQPTIGERRRFRFRMNREAARASNACVASQS